MPREKIGDHEARATVPARTWEAVQRVMRERDCTEAEAVRRLLEVAATHYGARDVLHLGRVAISIANIVPGQDVYAAAIIDTLEHTSGDIAHCMEWAQERSS